MLNMDIICSCKVSAGFAFLSNPAGIFLIFLSSHITSKTLGLESYLLFPLIVDCIYGIHCPITIVYILFLFSWMISYLSRYFSALSPTFSVWGVYSLRFMLNIQPFVLPQIRGRLLHTSCYVHNVFYMSKVLQNTILKFVTKLVPFFFWVYPRVDITFRLSLGYHQQILLRYSYNGCWRALYCKYVSYEPLSGIYLSPQ